MTGSETSNKTMSYFSTKTGVLLLAGALALLVVSSASAGPSSATSQPAVSAGGGRWLLTIGNGSPGNGFLDAPKPPVISPSGP